MFLLIIILGLLWRLIILLEVVIEHGFELLCGQRIGVFLFNIFCDEIRFDSDCLPKTMYIGE